jgi:cold shock CspA family protein
MLFFVYGIRLYFPIFRTVFALIKRKRKSMGRSNETFNKKEKEKLKQKKQQEKKERAEERKANSSKGKSLDEMMAYIDENGNISSTPPDPSKRRKIAVEDIQIGVAKQTEEDVDPVRNGVVAFFNESKGYGFIKDLQSQESIFVHINGLVEAVKENDKVTFETERGQKGLNAIKVKKVVK